MITDITLIKKLRSEPLIVWSIISNAVSITKFIPFQKGSVFCPFHLDTNKPSAVFRVQDEDEVDKLQCFVCAKQYTSYHYIKLIQGIKPLDYILESVNELVVKAYIERGLLIVDNINQENKEYIDKCFQLTKDKDNPISDFVSMLYNT